MPHLFHSVVNEIVSRLSQTPGLFQRVRCFLRPISHLLLLDEGIGHLGKLSIIANGNSKLLIFSFLSSYVVVKWRRLSPKTYRWFLLFDEASL
jgi:hypothetical protein